MDDRRLLELAAKACGYDTTHPWNAERLSLDPPVADLCIDGVSTAWNPITHSDDAFYLAVMLKMEVGVWFDKTTIDTENTTTVELHRTDPYAATRRAIVRAAATIAQEMTDD